jgi:hypothetical protein
MNIPVIEAYKNCNGNIVLTLTDKSNLSNKKSDSEQNIGNEDDTTKKIKEIDSFINKNLPKMTEKNVEIEKKVKKKDASMKATKQNDKILMIEKTFGRRFGYLLFYLGFVVFVLYFIITKNNVETSLLLADVLNTEFFQNNFPINLTIYDFYTQDNNNNFNINNYTYYVTQTNLDEIEDNNLLGDWLNNVFWKKLGLTTSHFLLLKSIGWWGQ